MTLGDRINKIVNDLGLNPTSFSKKLKYKNNVQIYEYIKGTRPGPEFFNAIIQEIPSVNIEWLIAEKGEPFRAGNEQDKDLLKKDPDLEKQFTALQTEHIELLKSILMSKEEALAIKIKHENEILRLKKEIKDLKKRLSE